jgi:hypothetical protein
MSDTVDAFRQTSTKPDQAQAELVVVVRSLAARPQGEPPPWSMNSEGVHEL